HRRLHRLDELVSVGCPGGGFLPLVDDGVGLDPVVPELAADVAAQLDDAVDEAGFERRAGAVRVGERDASGPAYPIGGGEPDGLPGLGDVRALHALHGDLLLEGRRLVVGVPEERDVAEDVVVVFGGMSGLGYVLIEAGVPGDPAAGAIVNKTGTTVACACTR